MFVEEAHAVYHIILRKTPDTKFQVDRATRYTYNLL